MRMYGRALSAAMTATVLGVGLAAAPAVAAQGATPARPHPAAQQGAQRGLLDPLLLVVQQLPVLSGTAGVGSLLSLSQPVWNLAGVTNSVQWLRDGVAIPGATGWSYTPSVDDAGTLLQGVVTGSLLGLLPVQTFTNVLAVPALGGGGGVTDVLSVLQLPSLSGTPGVGSLLTLLDPVWSLPGVSMAYQWFADGSPISGATGSTYVPVLGDAGTQIFGQVTGTLLGLPVVSTVTSPVAIPLPLGQSMSATSAPTVTGTAKVGRTLSAGEPTWSQDGVTEAYQWMRDDRPITGATTANYLLTATDLGHAVKVVVTGSKAGYTDATVSSDASTVDFGDAPSYAVQPTVGGIHRLGRTLTADPGSWGSGATPTYGYQWKRDGVAVTGATDPTYRLAAGDVGHRIAVTVTATRTGYRTGTFTTSGVAVPKAATTVRLRAAKSRVRSTAHPVVTVKLAAGGLSPRGTVRILDGTRTVRRVVVGGSKKVTLPRLSRGVHHLRAVYAGSATTAGARSKVITIVVR